MLAQINRPDKAMMIMGAQAFLTLERFKEENQGRSEKEVNTLSLIKQMDTVFAPDVQRLQASSEQTTLVLQAKGYSEVTEANYVVNLRMLASDIGVEIDEGLILKHSTTVKYFRG